MNLGKNLACDITITSRDWKKIVQFLPKFLEFSIVRRNRRITLLGGTNFFLNIKNSKNVTLLKTIFQFTPHLSCAIQSHNAFSNLGFYWIVYPWHDHSVATIPCNGVVIFIRWLWWRAIDEGNLGLGSKSHGHGSWPRVIIIA